MVDIPSNNRGLPANRPSNSHIWHVKKAVHHMSMCPHFRGWIRIPDDATRSGYQMRPVLTKRCRTCIEASAEVNRRAEDIQVGNYDLDNIDDPYAEAADADYLMEDEDGNITFHKENGRITDWNLEDDQ